MAEQEGLHEAIRQIVAENPGMTQQQAFADAARKVGLEGRFTNNTFSPCYHYKNALGIYRPPSQQPKNKKSKKTK